MIYILWRFLNMVHTPYSSTKICVFQEKKIPSIHTMINFNLDNVNEKKNAVICLKLSYFYFNNILWRKLKARNYFLKLKFFLFMLPCLRWWFHWFAFKAKVIPITSVCVNIKILMLSLRNILQTIKCCKRF